MKHSDTASAMAPTRREAIQSVLDKYKIYVVASYRQHFLSWCDENEVPYGHQNVKHVSKPEHLQGVRKVPLFLAYGWWKDTALERAVFDYCSMNGIYPETLPRALVISLLPR